jgi:hypothetical protein
MRTPRPFSRGIQVAHGRCGVTDRRTWRSRDGAVASWVTPFDPPEGKGCTKCGRFLPFSDFRPNLRLLSGWDSWCRDCHLEANRRWRAAHPEAARGRRRAEPVEVACTECGERFLGRPDRVVCDKRRCKDARYRRLHPEEWKAKVRRKSARARARQKGQPGMTERLLEELGADRRVVVRPYVGHSGAVTVFVDLDYVADVREVPVVAFVLACAAGAAVELDELHVIGLHGDEDKGVGLARVDFSKSLTTMREEGRAAVCRVGRGRDMRRRPVGPPPLYLFELYAARPMRGAP